MIGAGDNELALSLAVAAEEQYPADDSLVGLKEEAADRLRSSAQFLDPFKFAAQGFDRRAFYPCYGLAEATLFVSGGTPGGGAAVEVLSREALVENRAVRTTEASGRALVGSGRRGVGAVRIVDPLSRQVLVEGEVGEIWLAGESMAQGYWNRPEETAETFEARCHGASGEASEDTFLEDTFLRTGDLGFLLGEELFISGRLKDLIILRGRNLYPQDIEATAEEAHPDLRLGSGIAFSVEVDGEERLVVVHEVDRRAVFSATAEVAAALRGAVAQEHEAEVYEVVLIRQGTLPKTSSGKLQRRFCRSQYLEGGLRVVERHGALSRPSAGEDKNFATEVIDRVSCLTLRASERPPALRLLAELAEEIAWAFEEDKTEPKLAKEAPLGEGEDRPLSLGQSALWFVEGLAPESGVHHLVAAARGGRDSIPQCFAGPWNSWSVVMEPCARPSMWWRGNPCGGCTAGSMRTLRCGGKKPGPRACLRRPGVPSIWPAVLFCGSVVLRPRRIRWFCGWSTT